MAEDEWDDFKKYKSICIAQNTDWNHEYWIDVTADVWIKRIKEKVLDAKIKGFDGIWLDNGDIYWYVLEELKHKSKASMIYQSMVQMCKWIKDQGMMLILNGADTFVDALIDHKQQGVIDGVNQETVFSRIKSYKGNGTFGTQTSSDTKYFSSYCKKCKNAGLKVFLLEYTEDQKIIQKIQNFAYCDGYYISKSILL